MRSHPHLYEINAMLFLRRMAERHGRKFTLSTVPEEEWRRIADLGFDLVWLMGVWRRSPQARQMALAHPGLRREYDRIAPGWTEGDITGSAYAIYDYSLDPALGHRDDLAELKSILNRLGLGLILDFVPNHLALDHPWTRSHPEWFVQGSQDAVQLHPEWFFSRHDGPYLAHGRDPYFPPWNDTVQVNFYSQEMRQALVHELVKVSEASDGVRCDMAMLGLNHVFDHVWGSVLKDPRPPKTEFWSEAIGQVRASRSGFIFVAEVYWGLERELQRLGFDYTYDKPFYDRMRHSAPGEVLRHLEVDLPYQRRTVRFIENHDEDRAIEAFGRQRSRAAAVALATVPGMKLFHHGQSEGRRVKLPVQFACEPDEPVDDDVKVFYHRLLSVCDAPAFHDGEWGLLDVGQAWDSNASHRSLLAWMWTYRDELRLVVINYSQHTAQGRVTFSLPAINDDWLDIKDELAGGSCRQAVSELRDRGLYVELGPWEARILRLNAIDSQTLTPCEGA